MNRSLLLAAVGLATTASSVIAETEQTSAAEPIIVTATRLEYRDSDAPYASEVHTRRDIRNSGALSLYDYLDKNTSITAMPSYGNPFSQKIDMRGFGIGDGYQNIVVTVNGRRLNNIDLVPQLLSAVPLSSIERIEITKGSGSVIYGDGSTAGAIHIYTATTPGANISVAAGNHGMTSSSVNAALAEERFELAVTAENYHHDGYSEADISGQKDEADSNNTQAKLTLFASDALALRLGHEKTYIDNYYRGSLTQEQFDDDPSQNGGSNYISQDLESDVTDLGLTFDVNAQLSITLDHSKEDKTSEFFRTGWGSWGADYENSSGDLALQYNKGALGLTAGVQEFTGERTGADNRTSKDNRAYYLQGHYRLGATTVSLGGREEHVDYSYKPDNGNSLSDSHTLHAYDIGFNHRYSEALSVFANYNSAFQAPDIDRFFSYDWFTMTTTYNTFIQPAESKTLNIGINHTTADNTLKLTLFNTELENEIYLEPVSYSNTNIDQSHKYGLELQDSYRFNKTLSGSINYAYTRAVIDSEDDGNGAYDGKDLPGVSEHTLTVGLVYQPRQHSTVNLTHTHRSEAYAANDFANEFEQKQAAYNSTDIGYRYRVRNMELFARVENLFEEANGLWIRDDAIYPVNFTRNWRIGLRAEF